MTEWIRFALSAVFMILGAGVFVVGTTGIYKFRFVLNRMHSAAILDTMGLFLIVLGLAVARGFGLVTLKLFLIVVFLWLTSPISSHLIAKMEYHTDEDLGNEIENSIEALKGGDEDDPADL